MPERTETGAGAPEPSERESDPVELQHLDRVAAQHLIGD